MPTMGTTGGTTTSPARAPASGSAPGELAPAAAGLPSGASRRPRQSKTVLQYVAAGLLVTTTVAFVALEGVQGIIIAFGATEEMRVPLALLLPILLRACAQVVTYGIPIALLLGAGFLVGRLSADREVLALQASGVSALQLLLPPLAVGSVFAGFCLFLNHGVVPRSRASLRNVRALVANQLSAMGEGWNLELSPSDGQSIWIYHHDGPLLEGIFIGISGGSEQGLISEGAFKGVQSASYPVFLFAQRGMVSATEGTAGTGAVVELNGVSLFLDDDFLERSSAPQGEAAPDYMHMISMESLRLALRFPEKEVRPKYMPYRELVAHIEAARRRLLLQREKPPGEPRKAEREARDLYIALSEYHSRLSLSLCTMTFPATAFALGLWLRSSNRLLPFFLATAIVPSVYFCLKLLGEHYAVKGFLPWATEELGNVALAGLCVLFTWRAQTAPRS